MRHYRFLGTALLLIYSLPVAADEGEQIYRQTCFVCHDTGAVNAPRLGDPGAWALRLEQPVKTLMKHAIEGFNGMPPRGAAMQLSDSQVEQAVSFMLSKLEKGKSIAAAKPPAAFVTPTVDTGPDGISSSQSPVDRSHASLALARLMANGEQYHQPPPESEIPNDKYGDDVRLGKLIFTQTYKYARRYSGNDLSCSNCHLDAGRRPHSGPMWAAYGMYPAYRRKNDRNNTLEERIQDCFKYSMNGFAPTIDAPEMRALLSYIHFLSKGVPIGVSMPGRGYLQIVDTGHDPSPSRGSDLFKSRCASCHGKDGKGVKKEGGGYTFPPLWGMDSFNKAAGLHRTQLMAGFLKTNMPIGQENLTDQEALDLAAYIGLQLRPRDPRKGMIEGFLE